MSAKKFSQTDSTSTDFIKFWENLSEDEKLDFLNSSVKDAALSKKIDDAQSFIEAEHVRLFKNAISNNSVDDFFCKLSFIDKVNLKINLSNEENNKYADIIDRYILKDILSD